MPMRVAANLGFLFQEKPLLERFEAAAACGFKAVECVADIFEVDKQTLVGEKEKAGVEVVLLNLPKRITCVPGKEEEFRKDLDIAIDYATALKCPKIHLSEGALSTPMDWSNPEWQQAKMTCLSNVQYAAEKCQSLGIIVTLEAVTTNPNNFLQYQQQVADIVRKVGKDNVKVQFDFFHAQRKGGNICEFLTQNVDIIGHIQVSQVPGRHEPDLQGELNCPFIFKTLETLGYDGWLGAEYYPRGKVEDGLEWARDFIRNT